MRRQLGSRLTLCAKANTPITRTGVLCIILCFALGIANIFHFDIIILWSVICLYVSRFSSQNLGASPLTTHLHSISAFILIFIEIPLLLRVCPTSESFDRFIRRFETNYMRAAIYGIMSVIQWLSLIRYATSLIAAAVVLLLAAAFYALAGLKKQEFAASKTLGGQGVAQMIV